MITSSDLSQHIGTGSYHKFSSLFRHHVLTDGTKFLADSCGAFWMMDDISSYHVKCMKHPKLREMQIWRFTKLPNRGGSLTCWTDLGQGAQKPVIKQRYERTDFFDKYEGDEITLYVMPSETEEGTILWVVMLPSEY